MMTRRAFRSFPSATVRANSSPFFSTALGQAAASMAPGQWLNFGANSGTTGLGIFTGTAGSSGVRTAYASEMAVDVAGKRLLFAGGDHNESGRFLIYNESSNAWAIDHQPTWSIAPGEIGGRHGYDHSVFIPSTGKYYSRLIRDLNIQKWNGSGNSWTPIAIPLFATTDAAGHCFHAALNKLLVFQLENGTNGALIGMDPATETWVTYVSGSSSTLSPAGDPHSFATYNPTSQVAWFGGGNGANTTWTINGSAVIQAAATIPAPLSMIGPSSGPSLALPRPDNGNFIVWRDASTSYDFDASARTYAARGGTSTAFSENMLAFFDGSAAGMAGVIGCTYFEYGVFVFVKAWARSSAAEMWLFKP